MGPRPIRRLKAFCTTHLPGQKKDPFRIRMNPCTEGGTRTRTSARTLDFESSVSTNSTTSAIYFTTSNRHPYALDSIGAQNYKKHGIQYTIAISIRYLAGSTWDQFSPLSIRLSWVVDTPNRLAIIFLLVFPARSCFLMIATCPAVSLK